MSSHQINKDTNTHKKIKILFYCIFTQPLECVSLRIQKNINNCDIVIGNELASSNCFKYPIGIKYMYHRKQNRCQKRDTLQHCYLQ